MVRYALAAARLLGGTRQVGLADDPDSGDGHVLPPRLVAVEAFALPLAVAREATRLHVQGVRRLVAEVVVIAVGGLAAVGAGAVGGPRQPAQLHGAVEPGPGGGPLALRARQEAPPFGLDVACAVVGVAVLPAPVHST